MSLNIKMLAFVSPPSVKWNGMATIPPERGIFLKTTWRMHPDVCRFISDAVYDSRLEPETANNVQRLILFY